jgi:hypothetical protein
VQCLQCVATASACDIAYCLSLLTYTDKPVKKLADRFKLYQNWLVYDEIYECFLATLSRIRKFARVEAAAIEELEARINAWHSAERQEDGELAPSAAAMDVVASSTTSSTSSTTKKPAATRTRRTTTAAAAATKGKATTTTTARRSARSTRGVCHNCTQQQRLLAIGLALTRSTCLGCLYSAKPSKIHPTKRSTPPRTIATAILIFCNVPCCVAVVLLCRHPGCRCCCCCGTEASQCNSSMYR